MRTVTEQDFRRPEFHGKDPADYEFRKDGAIVRKDRWETAVRDINSIVGSNRNEFEISDVVNAVQALADNAAQSPADNNKMDVVKEIGADRLAYECAKLIAANQLDTRSGVADALLDYLDVGHPGGPKDVPEWVASYEQPNTK